MAMRLTGLMSGMDTESIIQELVAARRTKVDSKKKAQTKLEWKQEAWKDLNTKLKNLQSKYISNMRFQSSFGLKTTKVSNSSAASVMTSESATIGTQTLRITSLAKSGYMTGGMVEAKDDNGNAVNPTALTKMSQLGFEGEGSFDITLGNGSKKTINVNGDSSISDVLNQLKDAGVNANFDANNKRIFISSKSTGATANFEITASTADGNDALAKLGLQTSEYYATMAGKDISEYTSEIDAAVNKKVAAYAKRHNELEGKLARYDELSGKYNSVTDLDGKIASLKESLETAGDDSKEAIQNQISELEELQSLGNEKDKIENEKAEIEEYITVGTDSEGLKTYAANGDKIRDEVTASYQARIDQAAERTSSDMAAATKIEGTDAEIYLNNARFTNSSNVFNINGLTITAQETTGADEITLSTSTDTDGIYDMVKNFLKEYNSIINEMDKLYNADSAKGFEPLTDEEKDAMSETEAEKYEKKIRDSLLRRDDNLNTVSSALKEVMAGSINVNGKNMSLGDFGIATLGYFNALDNEKNAYHIDGDADDKDTSGNADKLKSMITTDPDTVVNFFTGLANKLYDKMGTLTKSVDGYRTFGNFYDDKKMKSDYTDYTSKIADMEEKLNEYEDKWYRKFSKMETAMAKMQSNMSAVTGMLGGGS